MTSPVGSVEEIGKLQRLQELVDLLARAISNRISSGSCTLVSVAGFDDPALRLFAKPAAASLLEAKVGRAVSCSTSNCWRSRVYFTIVRGAADPPSTGRLLHLRGHLVVRADKFIKCFVALGGSTPRKLARHRPFHQPAPYLALAKSLPGAFDRIPESFG